MGQVQPAHFDVAQVVEHQVLQRLLVAGELLGLRQQQVVGERGDGGPEGGRRRETNIHNYTMGFKIADSSASSMAV